MQPNTDSYVYDAQGNRYTVMRSRAGYVMCDRCLEVIPQTTVEAHSCVAWWDQPIDYGVDDNAT